MVAGAQPAAEIEAQRVKVDDTYLTFKADVGSATLVGSADTAAKATLIDINHDVTRSAIDAAADKAAKNLLNKRAIDTFVHDYAYPPQHGADPKAMMLDFVGYARTDVLNPELMQLS